MVNCRHGLDAYAGVSVTDPNRLSGVRMSACPGVPREIASTGLTSRQVSDTAKPPAPSPRERGHGPMRSACRGVRRGGSIAVGADDFAAAAGTQCQPCREVDRVLDEADAAVAHGDVDAAWVPTVGVAEVRPPAGADATAVRK